MPEPATNDPGQLNIALFERLIIETQARLVQAQEDTAQTRASLATINPNTPAYKNRQADLKAAQANEVNIRATLVGYQDKLAATRTIVSNRNNPPPPPQTAEERAQGIENLRQKEANKAADKGYYTDKELEGFENDKAARGAATTNAQTNAQVAAEGARHNKVVEEYNASVAKVNEDIATGKLDVERGQLLLNQKYNDAKIAFDRIEAENKAASTLVADETTQRGQDITEAQGIRSQVGTNTNNYLDFLQGTMRYLKKGTVLTSDDVLKLSAAWDDMNHGQEVKRPRTPASPVSPARTALTSTAEGAKTEPIKTVAEEAALTPKPPSEPGSVADAIDIVKSQYDEWMTAGGSGDWGEFQTHAAAIGSSAPGERPASVNPLPVVEPTLPEMAPIQAPEPTPPIQDPATQPPVTQQSIQAPVSTVPGAAGVGGITINVGAPAPAATPVVPPMAPPPVANPEQDEDFNTATSAATYDLLDGIVDDDVRQQFQVDPNQWGAFTQSVMAPEEPEPPAAPVGLPPMPPVVY